MPPKGPPKAPGGDSPFAEKKHFNHTLGMLVVITLLGALAIQSAFLWITDNTLLGEIWAALVAWFREFWPVWKVIAVALVVACVAWTILNLRKIHLINKEEEKIFGANPEIAVSEEGLVSEEKTNEKWARVLEHARSANPSDWRLAIIEADIMLDEMLRAKGYVGDSIGEMLKGIDPTDMLTLDAAWEAHKVRNRIAHSGADFQLNERETKRVIALFESVFKEAQII